MPNLKELGFKVGPSFIGYKHLISTPIQDGGFVRPETSVSNHSREWTVQTTNLEGPTFKRSSSKLHICQGQEAFTLTEQYSFWNRCFWMYVTSPSTTIQDNGVGRPKTFVSNQN